MHRHLLLLVFLVVAKGVWAAGPNIAAASDLKFALDEVVKAFEKQGGKPVNPVYGSSGNFVRQIAQGAPFEMFLSADEAYVFELDKKGLAQDPGALYAVGRIVLFVPNNVAIKPDVELKDVRAASADGRLTKFSIANPEHAPYGRAAREALTALGIWEVLAPKLVLGENVSQAAQFVASGSAQAGIFSLSLAVSPNFARAGMYVTLPESLHAPLRQRMVLLKSASPTSTEFYAFVKSPAARAILRKYGFTLPGE
ncbi:molybdate ABC transporter substrate-binding protein [Cupriavidus basilensis]|uniref:molybdate ABC transporter substrate-binding protein n=1 Tax=Cupriavidus basilensis TaxID=68895 RepID=UPI0023E8075E|nr:molybdate ABC transporter substrate-binding protein [Cupriavidus basilensis]MDF3885068.1 molybdate ABC transporter substrate-binding protein [Cupriavidus basilensis]